MRRQCIIYDLATDIKNDDRVNGSMRFRVDRAGKSWFGQIAQPADHDRFHQSRRVFQSNYSRLAPE
jgi:hypothetical protein